MCACITLLRQQLVVLEPTTKTENIHRLNSTSSSRSDFRVAFGSYQRCDESKLSQ